MTWHPLTTTAELDQITEHSHQVPCLIFKHSIRCNISFMAKLRLETNWDSLATEVEPYYLDLIAYRHLSDEIADRFHVFHESPQILLLKNGECIHDASHLDVSVQEIKEALS